ncbi:suppressor protein SRP40, putative [Ixodes scapularis]|uniref:Suppressor protein SRP40, putative n=1 Tax=Ixodes scapularis TaxID=6945 RepID=B7QIK4_IXOSC|nr:suppressor protein SRP40, putative [Ixodes scapularis]|eukprot:XP_002415011.1 suppressor protein SRP40, putative [Ixodes scapularis]
MGSALRVQRRSVNDVPVFVAQAVSSWGDLQPLRARMSQKSKVASKTSGSTKAPVPAPRKAAQPVATKGRSPSVDKKKASVTQQDSNKAAPSSTRSPSQPPDPKRTRDVSRHRETNRQERQKTTDGPANRAPKAKEAPLSKSLAVLQKSTATGPAGTSKKSSTGSRVDNSTTSRHFPSEKKERNTEKKAVPASSTTSSKEPSSKTGGRARLDAHQDSKKQSRHEMSATDESYNYDDDFEDYESDFEQDDDESNEEGQESSDNSDRTTGLTENVAEDMSCSHKSDEDAQKQDLSHWKSEPALDERKEPVEMTTSFSAYNLFNFASAKKKEESKKVLSKVQ